jgi:two-component system NtrC family response regulator
MTKLKGHILVVEDDASQREMLADFLRDQGATVRDAATGNDALRFLDTDSIDVVITDLRMPNMDGFELLRRIRQINPEIRVILATAYGTVEGAVSCLKNGAADYLLKPLDLDAVDHVVSRALEERHLRRENRELRKRLGQIESIPGIITAGGPMSEVLSTALRVAKSDVAVLLLGESGTGKELIARAIHAASGRATGPFVPVNATALSPTLLESELFGHEKGSFTGADKRRTGRFESAVGGTLFLDEIGDLPTDLQVKLLRVLQDKTIERVGSNRSITVDARLISATHSDLPARVQTGQFREDLFYRLAVVMIEIPPLRLRRADIPLLVEHFLERHSQEGRARSFSREAMDLLIRYSYPGNVRELENIVQRCLVLARGEDILATDLPPTVRQAHHESSGENDVSITLPQRVASLERKAIEQALDLSGGNQSEAARQLGISERALRYKRAKFHDG